MSRDYSKGKIYKIEAEGTAEIYIGSTIKLLCQRMASHRSEYKRWKASGKGGCKSFDLFDKYGLENCKIVLIELYTCSCKAELERREGELQKQLLGKGLVNQNIAGRSLNEWREVNKDKINEQKKQYNEANKDKIKEQCKVYRQKNVDKIKEQKKLYREIYKDKIKESRKNYYEINKDKIKEYSSQKIKCDCGCEIRKDFLIKHQKTKKHLELLKVKDI
jgi:hypothetical protein